MSQINKIAVFLAGPWLRTATLKKRVGDSILGIDLIGSDKPKDPALHRHAVEAIYREFGDDEIWALRVATSVYLQNCFVAEEIDRIVSEHAESRAGTFSSELYRGQGWAPDRALWFLGDQTEYWRGYVCRGGNQWMSSESALGQNDRFRSSGYELSGRRGCVQTIVLSQGCDERNLATLADGFANSANKLMWHACGSGIPDSLQHAIANRAEYDGIVGPANVTFSFTGINKQDWTVPPTVYFTLFIKWCQPSGCQISDSEIK